jgi:hypothetical protein
MNANTGNANTRNANTRNANTRKTDARLVKTAENIDNWLGFRHFFRRLFLRSTEVPKLNLQELR